ncbi:MAG: triose-phosphate isomerase [Kiritimatiellae bacterium]|nr:triose-phosphate isomerase [Kiritimatiellia bacterium]
MRKKIIAGNWKMNKTAEDSKELAQAIKLDLANVNEVDVVVCPTFTSLDTVSNVIGDTNIKLGAQNMHWEAEGAYTGEISASMLRNLYCHYVILGHSERREYFGETDEIVNKKAKAAIAAGLIPIVCVGETLEERESNTQEAVVSAQLKGSLAGLGASLAKVVVAYEPVWAIGTGLTASPEQAQEMHAFIRKTLAEISDQATADGIRIQYGGSMKPENAAELLSQPDIDGGLIGGAALKAPSFVALVKAAIEA